MLILFFRVFFFLNLAWLCTFGISSSRKKRNDNFKVSKITFLDHLCFFPIDDKDNRLPTEKIFDQEFIYLGKGRQCFVFESVDHKYVLKFLRFDRVQYPLWSVVPLGLSWQLRKIEKKTRKMRQWLQSYKVALSADFDFGVIFHNLDGKKVPYQVMIQDQTNKKYPVSLHQTLFLLQKKAIGLKDALKNSDLPEQKRIIQLFLTHVKKRLESRIINQTNSCMENVGWLDGHILEFDIGEMNYQEKLKDPFQQEKAFSQFIRPMREWLSREMPYLLSHFDEENRNFVNKKFE